MDPKGGNELTKFVGPNKRPAVAGALEPSSNLIICEKDEDKGKDKHGHNENKNENLTSTTTTTTNLNQGKENQNKDEQRLCHKCNKSLSKARHLINIAGQTHKWHPECFMCNVCHQPMDRANTCYIYKDKIVCRDDYMKLQRDNSIKCSRCLWPIGASDWVRRAGDFVYHLACFSCDICLRQMSTGEQFTVNIQDRSVVRLLCRLHFAIEPQTRVATQTTTTNMAMEPTSSHLNCTHTPPPPPPGPFEFSHGSQCSPMAGPVAENKSSSSKFSHQDHQHQQQYLHLLASTSQQSTVLLQQNRKHQPEVMSDDELNLEEDGEDGSMGCPQQQQHQIGPTSSSASSSNGSSSSALGQVSGGLASKSKRVRTTFTEDQLSILQTHFQVDSNPDGQDLERIATITGLSKRVTQVWFQNSRARQKKYMIKRKPSTSSSSTVISTLVSKTIDLAAAAAGHSSLQFGATGSGHYLNNHHHHYHHLNQEHQHSQQQQQQHHAGPLQPGLAATVGSEESESEGDFYQQQKWSNMSNRSDASAAMDDIDDQASRVSSNGSGSSSSSGSGTPSKEAGQLIVSDVDNSNNE